MQYTSQNTRAFPSVSPSTFRSSKTLDSDRLTTLWHRLFQSIKNVPAEVLLSRPEIAKLSCAADLDELEIFSNQIMKKLKQDNEPGATSVKPRIITLKQCYELMLVKLRSISSAYGLSPEDIGMLSVKFNALLTKLEEIHLMKSFTPQTLLRLSAPLPIESDYNHLERMVNKGVYQRDMYVVLGRDMRRFPSFYTAASASYDPYYCPVVVDHAINLQQIEFASSQYYHFTPFAPTPMNSITRNSEALRAHGLNGFPHFAFREVPGFVFMIPKYMAVAISDHCELVPNDPELAFFFVTLDTMIKSVQYFRANYKNMFQENHWYQMCKKEVRNHSFQYMLTIEFLKMLFGSKFQSWCPVTKETDRLLQLAPLCIDDRPVRLVPSCFSFESDVISKNFRALQNGFDVYFGILNENSQDKFFKSNDTLMYQSVAFYIQSRLLEFQAGNKKLKIENGELDPYEEQRKKEEEEKRKRALMKQYQSYSRASTSSLVLGGGEDDDDFDDDFDDFEQNESVFEQENQHLVHRTTDGFDQNEIEELRESSMERILEQWKSGTDEINDGTSREGLRFITSVDFKTSEFHKQQLPDPFHMPTEQTINGTGAALDMVMNRNENSEDLQTMFVETWKPYWLPVCQVQLRMRVYHSCSQELAPCAEVVSFQQRDTGIIQDLHSWYEYNTKQ